MGCGQGFDLGLGEGHPKRIRSGSRTVIGVDAHVVEAEVAGPDGLGGRAPAQADADGDLALAHDARALGFGVAGVAAAARNHVHVVEVQLDPVLV